MARCTLGTGAAVNGFHLLTALLTFPPKTPTLQP